jgi:drug/metabolite transporter (DMT)-like permease
MLKIILLILCAELWGVSGQIFFKKSVDTLKTPNLRSLSSYLKFISAVLKLPGIWLGMALVSTGVFFWIAALAQADLSLAYPIDSLQYLVTLVMARIFLDEKIDRMKLFGTLLVILGIIFIAAS